MSTDKGTRKYLFNKALGGSVEGRRLFHGEGGEKGQGGRKFLFGGRITEVSAGDGKGPWKGWEDLKYL